MNNSQLLNNLLIKTTQQLQYEASTKYTELALQKVTKITNGMLYQEYKWWTQGNNAFNFDPLNSSTTKTTGDTGFTDPLIADFAKRIPYRFEEIHYVDTNAEGGVYSNTYTIFDSVLNDFAITPALFMSIVNDVRYTFENSYRTYLIQRLIHFHSQVSNYDVVDATETTPTTIDEAYLTKFYTQLDLELEKLTTSRGYNVLKQKPTDVNGKSSSIVMWYDGADHHHNVLVPYQITEQTKFLVKAKLFNLEQFTFVNNSTIIPVNFENWIYLNKEFDTFTKGQFDTSKLIVKYIIIDDDNYQEFYWYQGSTDVQLNKLFRNMYFYTQHGQFKLKTEYAAIYGYKKSA